MGSSEDNTGKNLEKDTNPETLNPYMPWNYSPGDKNPTVYPGPLAQQATEPSGRIHDLYFNV